MKKNISVELPAITSFTKYLSLKIVPDSLSTEQLNQIVEDEKCENIYTINKWSTGNNKLLKYLVREL